MNLIIYVKNEKSWILKIVYVKHLLNFSDFFNQVVLQKLFIFSDQVARFFIKSVFPCYLKSLCCIIICK